MNKEFRFLDLPYFTPGENMAIDEALLENFTSKSLPILRLYTWERDAFTIGRFQDINSIENFQKFGENFTRRLTGGGLLLHGFDLSYSLLLPLSLLKNKSVKQSYEYICTFLLHFYENLGLTPNFAKDIMQESLSKSPFCQVGFEPYDIIISEQKIGGNAQKRTKHFIYQHGSIPLHKDSRSFSGTSLQEFGIDLEIQEAKELLKASFCKTFQTQLMDSKPSEEEIESFESLHQRKYKTKEWKYEKINLLEKENIR